MPSELPQIAVLGSFPPLRAISSYCLEFAKALATNTPVTFLSFKKIYPAFLYPGGKLEEDNSFPDIPSYNLTVVRKLTWYNPFSWFYAGFLTRADLLHAQWWSTPLLPIYIVILGAFRIRRKPVVITIHNVTSHEQSRWFSLLSGLLYRLGSHFIVHSKKNKEQLTKFHAISGEKISVVPHGPLELFAGNDMDKIAARKILDIPQEKKVLLLFGAIRPYKGVDTALNALALLKTRHPDIHLIIAGKLWGDWSPYQERINRLKLDKLITRHLDYVPTSQVGVYFKAADIVLLPYHHFDSQSGIGSASLAFEKPMIVSNTGGLPELVKDQRWVIPPRDQNALAQAIHKAIADPDILSEMAENARSIRAANSWPAIATRTLLIYKALLNQS